MYVCVDGVGGWGVRVKGALEWPAVLKALHSHKSTVPRKTRIKKSYSEQERKYPASLCTHSNWPELFVPDHDFALRANTRCTKQQKRTSPPSQRAGLRQTVPRQHTAEIIYNVLSPIAQSSPSTHLARGLAWYRRRFSHAPMFHRQGISFVFW